jgi:RNA polymerase sigma-70 factor, ECF subfamily
MREPEDEAAFDAFFSESWARLQSHAYVLTGSKESAQDLTQEAFLRAWKRWDKVVVYENPEAWTRKVLHNLCIDSWRKQRQRFRRPPVELDVTPDTAIPNDHYELAQAMRSLPGGQARALLLHDGLGMTVKETAAEIGVPEGTVKSWLSRARALVARRLDQARSTSEVRRD